MRLADQIADGLRKAREDAWESLTPREKEVCKLSLNLNRKEIAAAMGITRRSVKQLIKLVRRKIGWRADIYFGGPSLEREKEGGRGMAVREELV